MTKSIRPEKKTFTVYDYFELRDYLIETKQITQSEADEFWSWWCGDGGGPQNHSICYIPLGYWGWTDDRPQRQISPKGQDGLDAFKVLIALEQFADEGLKVWVDW